MSDEQDRLAKIAAGKIPPPEPEPYFRGPRTLDL